MCEALRKLMEPEITEDIQQAAQQTLKDVILKLFNAGTSAADISRIIEIPLEEVEAILL